MAVGGTNDWQAGDIANLLATAQFNSGSRLGIDSSDGPLRLPDQYRRYDRRSLGTLGKLGGNSLTLTADNSYSRGTEIRGTSTVQYYSLPPG